jgi:hypothetical protein
MPTTTRFNVTTPGDSTANDFADAMGDLAEDITSKMAGAAQGTYAIRPAAGTAGRFYYVTDTTGSDAVQGGLHYDNGTAWIRLTASPWLGWSVTQKVSNSAGSADSSDPVGSFSVSGLTGFQYRMLPGNLVEVDIECNVNLSGAYSRCGIMFSTPVTAARAGLLHATYEGDLAVCTVQSAYFGNAITIFPPSGFGAADFQFNGSLYMGRWFINTGGQILRVRGTYPV